MRPEDILYWLQAQPFVPFRVVMNSGRTFDVRHLEVIRLMRTTLVYFTPSDQEHVYDRGEMFGLVLIDHIEPLDRPASNVERAIA